MKIFSIPDQSKKKALRQDLLFICSYYFCMFLVVLLACISSPKFNTTSLISTTIACLMLFGYWIYRQLSELKQYYETYTLLVEDHHITEFYNHIEQSSFQPEQILKTDQGRLKARGGNIEIMIPAIIGDKDQLLQLLPPTDPNYVIKETRSAILKKLLRYPFILPTSLFVSYIFSEGAVHIVIGFIITFLLGLAFWILQKRNHLNQKEQPSSWWLILAVIIIFFDIALNF